MFPLAEQEDKMSDFRTNAAVFIAGRNGTARPQCDDSDGTRYSDQQVVFRYEFSLGESEEVYPPGRYVLEAADDSYSASGHTARVRKSTLLIVPTASGTRSIPINVGELESALKKDAEREQLSAEGEGHRMSNADAPNESVQSQLEGYGIERVPAEVFVWQGYRYTNASDAIAAAKRAEKR